MSPRGDVVADGLDAGLVRGPAQAGAEPQRIVGGSAVAAALLADRACREPSVDLVEAAASRRASPSSARPASQARPVRRSQATTQSWRARRSGGRPWSSIAIDGSRSSDVAEVVAEEPDEPAEEPRRVGRHERRRVEPGQQAAGDRERIGTRGRRLEHRDRVGRQVGPARVAARGGRSRAARGRAGRGRPRPRRSARIGDPVGQAPRPERVATRASGGVRTDGDHAGDDTAGPARRRRRPATDRPGRGHGRPLASRDASTRPRDPDRPRDARARSTPSPTSPA